jgi:ABC-2 type transport system ATP-binding protein
MSQILELRNLTKHYGNLKAVEKLSLSIREGICFGLLGPNGAGKSTTLEMIEGVLEPTSGEILYRGVPVDKKFRQEVGIQFQATALPEKIFVSEVLSLFGSFYPKRADANELKNLCDLSEFWNRDASQLSGGQRQRLLLALALINDPQIVFLDEPTTGLDPGARRNFWELVRKIKALGKTIVLTTHYMEEAYELCDEIVILNRGKIIAQGEPNSLLQEHFSGISILLPQTEATKEVAELHSAHFFPSGGNWEILTSSPEKSLRELLELGVSLQGIQIRNPTLEDLFLKLTGEGISS